MCVYIFLHDYNTDYLNHYCQLQLTWCLCKWTRCVCLRSRRRTGTGRRAFASSWWARRSRAMKSEALFVYDWANCIHINISLILPISHFSSRQIPKTAIAKTSEQDGPNNFCSWLYFALNSNFDLCLDKNISHLSLKQCIWLGSR